MLRNKALMTSPFSMHLLWVLQHNIGSWMWSFLGSIQNGWQVVIGITWPCQLGLQSCRLTRFKQLCWWALWDSMLLVSCNWTCQASLPLWSLSPSSVWGTQRWHSRLALGVAQAGQCSKYIQNWKCCPGQGPCGGSAMQSLTLFVVLILGKRGTWGLGIHHHCWAAPPVLGQRRKCQWMCCLSLHLRLPHLQTHLLTFLGSV